MIQIKVSTYCSGCFACASICPKQCITMVADKEGFLYPDINQNECIHCNLCENICPMLSNHGINTKPNAYAAKNTDTEIRNQSTSGGVFSILSEYVLSRGGIVFGATYNDKFEVEHIGIESMDEISKLRGAKYAQSRIGEVYKNVKVNLERKRMVLFSGTPCQVSGLKSYLNNCYNQLICVDLICHGVISPSVWSEYVKYRIEKDGYGQMPRQVNLRCKASGWSRYSYSVLFEYEKGNYCKLQSEDLMMNAFGANVCLRPSCSNCHFKGLERDSDFTLGDYWGIWNQISYFDDNKGVSLVFVNTKKGQELWGKLQRKMDVIEVEPTRAIEENMSAVESSIPSTQRELFMENVKIIGFEESVRNFINNNSNKTKARFVKKCYYKMLACKGKNV